MPGVPEAGRLRPDRHAASRVVPRLGGAGPRRESARVFNVGFSHSSWFSAWKDSGEQAAEPPLFAVRKALNGRIALLPVDPGYIIWNVGNPAFPQVFMELGDGKDNPSNGFRLIENALRWLAEPARSRGSSAGSCPTPTPSSPTASRKRSHRCSRPGEAPARAQFRGLIGARSEFSDGRASVAQYAATARKLGLAFLFFAEPWESLSEEKLKQLRASCRGGFRRELPRHSGYPVQRYQRHPLGLPGSGIPPDR